jgi:hypothetical protein
MTPGWSRKSWRAIVASLLLGAALSQAHAQYLLEGEPVDQQSAAPPDPRTWTLQPIAMPEPAERVLDIGDGTSLRDLRIRAVSGAWYRLRACGEALCAEAMSHGFTPPRLPAGALVDTLVAEAERNIRAAWLAGPTQRLGPGALGETAGRLEIIDGERGAHTLELAIDSVFEDREARIADLDGDGRDEIVVVRTTAALGAALSIIAVDSSGARIVAESPPAGAPQGWLSPVAIADLDGDGAKEIAIVRDPAGNGVLELWRYENDGLHRVLALPGFSNHQPQSPVGNIAAAGDFDGDGTPDLAVPSTDRQVVKLVSFAGGEIATPGRIALPQPASFALHVLRLAGRKRPVLLIGLADGSLVLAR